MKTKFIITRGTRFHASLVLASEGVIMKNKHFPAVFPPVIFSIIMMVLACFLGPNLAQGQVTSTPPERLTYQGYLTDGNGAPLGTNAPKNYDVQFFIYQNETGGTNLWAEQQTVTVDNGYFSVLLGEGTPIGIRPDLSTIFSGSAASSRYIQMTVLGIGAGGANVNILPRLRFLTSPYAFLSRNSSAILGSNGSTLISSVGSTVIVSGVISGSGAGLTGLTSNQIPNLPASKITSGTFDTNRIPSLNAAIIGSGTLADGRLSANVVLENVANDFTANQEFSNPVGMGKAAGGRSLEINGNFSVTNSASAFYVESFAGGSGKVLSGQFFGIGTNAPQLRFIRSVGGPWSDIGLNPASSFVVEMNDVETFFVTTNGNVGVGSAVPADKLDVNGTIRSTGYRTRSGTVGSYGNNLYNFFWTGTQLQGWVDGINQGVVSFTSDRRLKEDIQPISGSALDRVLALKPASFKYKTIPGTIYAGDGTTIEGFIADELQQTIPSGVNGAADAVDADGKIQPQTINVVPLVAVLTKAVQELNAKLEKENSELKARVAELERMLEAGVSSETSPAP
jgi:Chaperone of endosialidase